MCERKKVRFKMNKNNIIIALLVIAIIVIVFQQDIRNLIESRSSPTNLESLAEMQAKDEIEKVLIDPKSATYKFEKTECLLPNNVTLCNVCGQVNSKNSFGGYVGYKKFMYAHGTLIIEGYGGYSEGLYKIYCD